MGHFPYRKVRTVGDLAEEIVDEFAPRRLNLSQHSQQHPAHSQKPENGLGRQPRPWANLAVPKDLCRRGEPPATRGAGTYVDIADGTGNGGAKLHYTCPPRAPEGQRRRSSTSLLARRSLG